MPGTASPRTAAGLTVGVLALQGDVTEHLRMLTACGVEAVPVRRPAELLAADGLVVPGGESTTIGKLIEAFELLEPLRKRVGDGMPTMGTCAGMIMLADRIEDGIEGQQTIGGIDMTVRRNAFGRQVDSFEADLTCEALGAPPLRAVFIRAPWVEEIGGNARALARVGSGPGVAPDRVGRIVAVAQDHLLATAFHPELTGDIRVHQYFVQLVKEA